MSASLHRVAEFDIFVEGPGAGVTAACLTHSLAGAVPPVHISAAVRRDVSHRGCASETSAKPTEGQLGSLLLVVVVCCGGMAPIHTRINRYLGVYRREKHKETTRATPCASHKEGAIMAPACPVIWLSYWLRRKR